VQLKRMKLISAFFLAVVLLFALSACVRAEEITRLSGVAELAHLKNYYEVPGFKIGGSYSLGEPASYELGGQGGLTLESHGAGPLRTAYIAVGTPQRNANGEIVNAVIISPYYAGDASYSYYFWYQGQAGNDFAQGPVVGPGLLIDTEKYYVVFLDALGLWGASKPSDGLGINFPVYNYFDYVQANYRLLKDHLKVAKIKLAMGFSMGAMQSYVWALLHPEMVEAIMPISGASTIKNDAVARWMFQLMTAAMKSDPVWRDTEGDYYHLPKESHPNQGLMFGWSLLAQSGFGYDMRIKQGWPAVKPEVFYWNPQGDQNAGLLTPAQDYDVNDLLYRNKAGNTYDIHADLSRISARTLIIHVANDQWLRLIQAEKSADAIQGARLISFESPMAHYGGFTAPNVMKAEIQAWLREIGLK
jgi:homoserine O-acetyltransferase